MKFSVKDFFSKYDQLHRKLRIWSYLLKKSLMENFMFCVVNALNHHTENSDFCSSSHLDYCDIESINERHYLQSQVSLH